MKKIKQNKYWIITIVLMIAVQYVCQRHVANECYNKTIFCCYTKYTPEGESQAPKFMAENKIEDAKELQNILKSLDGKE